MQETDPQIKEENPTISCEANTENSQRWETCFLLGQIVLFTVGGRHPLSHKDDDAEDDSLFLRLPWADSTLKVLRVHLGYGNWMKQFTFKIKNLLNSKYVGIFLLNKLPVFLVCMFLGNKSI